MTDTRAIRARIHDSALKRVTRAYAATLADIFAETLQNARRADATRVRVTLHGRGDDPLRIAVNDDGDGIDDPAVLLSFGENGWSDELVRREDAAGMGFLSLARRGCAVSSRPRAQNGHNPVWRVDLEPAHFLGEAEATVRFDDEAPFRHGTTVAFPAAHGETAATIRSALEAAALHYPLPVWFEHPPDIRRGTLQLPRRAFLDGAVHVECWRGLVFGVFRYRPHRFGFADPDVNFHGLGVTVRLPVVGSVGGADWSVAAEIEDCPELELVLPARKEAVETPFLAGMREAARLAIYAARAVDRDPRPTFDDWRKARQAAIDIAPPPAELRPWRPATADVDNWRDGPKPARIGEEPLIVACHPEPPEAQAFWRAARRNGVAHRLFEPDGRLEGYDWYDAIPRLSAIGTEVTADGRTLALEDWPEPERASATEAPPPQRPEAIRIRAAVRGTVVPDTTVRGIAGEERMLDLPTDLAFAGEPWAWVVDALPLITADSPLDPHELAQVLYEAYFSPSDDSAADSWETQRLDFEREALHMATRLLVSDDEARRRSIADVVERQVCWLIPKNRGVDIAVRGGRVTVTLGEPAAESAP